jgi:RNA polymerase sigma-70 factor (ECF subfamily)
MGRPCVRGQPPLLGLVALHDEIVRFRADPRRQPGFVGAGGSPLGSNQRHVTPSAQPRPGTAAARMRSETVANDPNTATDVRSVPGPAEPPSGPLSVIDGRVPSSPEMVADGAPDATVAELVARAQAGEADAFGLLYDRYLELVYRYIYYRVGSVALAEDLASETFLRALRRIDSFTWQGRDFAAWLVTIARNLITDHYKSSRYRLEITTEDILDAAPPATADSPENQVLDALTNKTLLEAVRQLNPEQQECIVLRFLQGLSVNETALVMGKNDGAIKALQYRAVRALARLLPEEKLR